MKSWIYGHTFDKLSIFQGALVQMMGPIPLCATLSQPSLLQLIFKEVITQTGLNETEEICGCSKNAVKPLLY